MHDRSVAEQVVLCLTASLRQVSEQLGRSARLWAALRVAMARDARANNFMMTDCLAVVRD
jgi:hypothetical protein